MIQFRHALRPLAALVALAALPAATGHPSFDRRAWQADFAQLEAALEQRYANLAWMASPGSGIDVAALDRRARAALAAARSDAEARDAILAFVRGFGDGHLSEVPTLAASGTAAEEPPRPALDPGDPQSGCAALRYASTGSVAFSLPFETLPGSRLIADGLADPFRAAILALPKGKLGILRIQTFRPDSYPAVCLAAWQALAARGAAITADALRSEASEQWFGALAARLRMLREAGARAVLVDVGNNSGGNDSGDWLARLFTDRPLASARLLVTAAPDGVAYLDEEIETLAPLAAASTQARDALAFFTAAKARAAAQHCDLGWAWRERRPWEPLGCSNLIDAGFASGPLRAAPPAERATAEALYWPTNVAAFVGAWTGPVYVLTDGKTYSSAEMFAAVMQDNHVARLAGTRTGGDGCGFMSSGTPLVLAHSRLRFRIPNCVRLRADGTDEVAGIAPDIALPPLEGESARARAKRLADIVIGEIAP